MLKFKYKLCVSLTYIRLVYIKHILYCYYCYHESLFYHISIHTCWFILYSRHIPILFGSSACWLLIRYEAKIHTR